MSRVSNLFNVTIAPAPIGALATLAASMTSGQWAQMSPAPAGLGLFSNQDGTGDGCVVEYLSTLAYDSVGKRIWCIGGDHGGTIKHLEYNETGANANSWVQIGVPSFFSAPGYHGYDHTTWDSSRSRLFNSPYGTQSLFSWDPSVGGTSWTGPQSFASVLGSGASTRGVEYFPERNSILIFAQTSIPNGKLIEYTAGGSFVALTGETLNGASDLHQFICYSQVRQLCYFGGGNGSNALWTINAAGTITSRAAIPSSITANGALGPAGPGAATPFVNPANGNLVALAGLNNWQEYNPDTNTWSAKSGAAQILAANTFPSASGYGTCAVTLWNYGVVVFVKNYGRGSPAEMWLWKP